MVLCLQQIYLQYKRFSYTVLLEGMAYILTAVQMISDFISP